ncbi:putative MFS family arabinose efflux permease [Pedobacter cryoconitis]|uniref:Putative MFS family arabinose efflux permease n=1 Tax=Pedobacter cryoconitis TaxID=188932 RepID=A0A7W8ZR29_9SPHI|nr:MFS transporter [Pedobacter cryoconitis]MBB5638656.1 putative MFS family arabinose efflux permease [Pedobacter cryoconitis]
MKNKIAYIGCLSLIGMITTEFGVIGILPQLAEYYQISIDKAGLLLSAYAMVVALAGPLMTMFASGFNRKHLMALTMVIFLITGIVSSMAPPFWLLMTVRVLPAFLHPVLVSTAVAAATSTADQKDAHKMMAIVIGGISIATITTVPFAAYIAGVFNHWQSSFMVQAVISLIVLLSIIFLLPSMPGGERKSYRSQISILKKPAFIASSLFAFFMIGSIFSTYSYFAGYLSKVNGMDEKTISLMLLLFGLTGVLGNFIAGKLLSRNITRITAVFLIGLIAVSVPLYFSGPMSARTVLLIAVWGFLQTPCFLTSQAYMIETAPEAPEFANSISISFGNLGISIGTAIGGLSIATYGIHSTPWIMFGFGIAALVMMLIKKMMEAP